ncbi:MAG TPA: hypothetical protein VMB51_00285 [Solirubrobacteraceae bacterium]|nr:hypothetical protein [Solirubrobacteraceae bacterium]
MVEQLEAIFDRLARAEDHLEAIEGQLLAYYNSDPYQMSGKYESDADGGGATVEPTDGWVDPIPVRLNTLVGEFLHDLRSALDHLARQLVIQGGHEPASREEIPFPVFTKAPVANKAGKKALPNFRRRVSIAAREVIHEAQPYQWGDAYARHPLWILHQLWNIDKHRDVVVRGVWPYTTFRGELGRPFGYTAQFKSASEDMAEYVLVPNDPTVNLDADTTVQVALYEPECGIEHALLRTLKEILKLVLGVANAAEDRCF